MRKIHLICNAHLDPVWLWRWQEGCTEALSTFRVAEGFTDEFPGFAFNHNEAILYQWVKENEPDLFERIQQKVKEGKWHIMGGWYLQPTVICPPRIHDSAIWQKEESSFWKNLACSRIRPSI